MQNGHRHGQGMGGGNGHYGHGGHGRHHDGRRQDLPIGLHGGDPNKQHRPLPLAPSVSPSVPAPPAPPTAQQVEEIVKKTKNILFEKLSPLCKSDRVDFNVSSHNGRIEFSFPFKTKINLVNVCQIVCDTARKGETSAQGETLIAFLREKFMCLRIKDTSPAAKYGPPFRIEVMIPLDVTGNGLVMGGASGFTLDDIDMCESLYKLSSGLSVSKDGKADAKESKESIVDKLRGLGVDVMIPEKGLEEEDETEKKTLDPELEKMWETIAGYDEIKSAVKQCITLPLMRPEIFERMAALTRGQGTQGKKTSGVLFTGPPGVGKTSIAKVASHIASTPLVYVPVESVVSKWYGEAEQKLRSVFDLTRKLGKAVLFLDELDAFAGNRDNAMHEVTRRMLSVLLRQLDGLDNQDVNKDGAEGEEKKKWHVVLVGATNRPSDLDAALRSRFNKLIDFPLPDESTRALIFKTYSKTLENAELAQLAAASEGFSGRDIREVADDAEHNWVAQLLNEGGFDMSLRELQPPPYKCYLESVKSRKQGRELKY